MSFAADENGTGTTPGLEAAIPTPHRTEPVPFSTKSAKSPGLPADDTGLVCQCTVGSPETPGRGCPFWAARIKQGHSIFSYDNGMHTCSIASLSWKTSNWFAKTASAATP